MEPPRGNPPRPTMIPYPFPIPAEYGGQFPMDRPQYPPAPGFPMMPHQMPGQEALNLGQHQPNNQSNDDMDFVNMQKQKGKRRSKNDQEGRVYKCNHCDRTYLSYPALYTHIKTKHSLPGEVPSLTNGRGRGRPKKNMVNEDKPDPSSPLYFRTEDKKGGQTAVVYGFEEAYNMLYKEEKKYGGYQNHPLYIELYKLHTTNITTYNYQVEHPGMTEFGLPPEGMTAAVITLPQIVEPKEQEEGEEAKSQKEDNLNNENAEDKSSKQEDRDEDEDYDEDEPPQIGKEELQRKTQRRVDQIFAEYLDYAAKKVKKEYYKHLLKFIFLFRESLNRFEDKLKQLSQNQGMHQFAQNNSNTEKKAEDQAEQEKSSEMKEYCLANNAEQVPDISNEFVTIYLEEVKAGIQRIDAIELTQNVCHWLFVNGYTCSKLSLIQDNT